MTAITLKNFAEGRWVAGSGEPAPALLGGDGRSCRADLIAWARLRRAWPALPARVGGPALRALTFHERAAMLKLAGRGAHRPEAGALRTELRNGRDQGRCLDRYRRRHRHVCRLSIQGPPRAAQRAHSDRRQSSKASRSGGTFQGLHVFTSLQGVAVHINAFNFPVWGMLEKLAPTLLAGVPRS